MRRRRPCSARGADALPSRVGASPRTWLYRIATNVCLRALERRAIACRLMPDSLGSAVFVGWPTYALSSQRPPQQDQPPAATIQVWWRASDAQALYERAVTDGVPILVEPFDGPFGRTFALAVPDGYRITIYERDQPLFWPPKD
jgi:glyoxalase/bleomycin resistance protein/dioxygenase superfamily protein